MINVSAEIEEVRGVHHAVLGTENTNPQGMSLWELWAEDLRTHEGDWLGSGFFALAVHRFGNWRMGVRPRLLRAPLTVLYRVLALSVRVLCGIDLPYTVKLGRRFRIWHRGGITISAISFGDDCHLRQNVTMGVKRRGDPIVQRPTIGHRCDFGAGAVVVGGITVGDDSVIGANVVLAEDVPPGSVVTLPRPTIRARRS